MQAINIIGLMDYIDEVITVLGDSGVFHPDAVSTFYSDLQGFTHLKTNSSNAETLVALESALSLTKREFKTVDVSDYNPPVEELESMSVNIADEINAWLSAIASLENELKESVENLGVAEHFAGMDVEIDKLLKLKYMKARFGRLPKDSYPKLEAYKDNDYVDFAVCTEDKTHYWGVYFAPISMVKYIDKIFEGLYFEAIDLFAADETPNEKIEEYKKQIPILKSKLKEAKSGFETYLNENSEKISNCRSKLKELYLYSSIRSKAMQHSQSFIVCGWIPSSDVNAIQKKLKKIRSVELALSDAKNEMDKQPPVKLKNSFFVRPFEFFTEMYGVPRYNEMDPTVFVAITYVVIFGIMFADLGQGLCLSLVGYLMWKLKKMKIGKILMPCGISAALFGTLFGSVFGFEHLLDPMFRSLGFKEKPIEVMASENTNTIILGAIGIGVVLLIIAMFLNVYSSLKQKNYGKALFSTSGAAGIIFYSSLVFGLACEIFLGFHVMNPVYIIGLVVLPFLLVFFCEPLSGLVNGEKNWQPESWGGYIVENIFESIEVLLSYVTNTMSFLRVGAFVLVHAGMMLVVFVLAETVGGVGYWIVVVIGNGLVMALEALLVSIQVLRLEYYEMFSRFYSGEGRQFEPVKLTAE